MMFALLLHQWFQQTFKFNAMLNCHWCSFQFFFITISSLFYHLFWRISHWTEASLSKCFHSENSDSTISEPLHMWVCLSVDWYVKNNLAEFRILGNEMLSQKEDTLFSPFQCYGQTQGQSDFYSFLGNLC